MTIEIGSFLLGIGVVMLLAAMVIGVVAFFRGITLEKRVNKEIQRFGSDINDVINQLNQDRNGIYSTIVFNKTEFEKQVEGIYRQMDSRFDKLTNKITIKDNGDVNINGKLTVKGEVTAYEYQR